VDQEEHHQLPRFLPLSPRRILRAMPPPTRPELRTLLDQRFAGASDFDAFVVDHFPDVYRRFTNGMDRVQKTTILLTYADLALLAETLRKLANMIDPGPVPRAEPSTRTKILFLAANPTTTELQLTREVRSIEERIGVGKPRDALVLSIRWAVRPGDIQRALLEEEPHVLHFSGHGSPRAQLMFEDGTGATARIDKDAFADLIGILRGNLRLVVLNACDTEPIAQALVRHVDFAVGMREPIGDEAAIAFSSSFYQALGFGKPVDTAFRLGCNELRLKRISDGQTPRLEVKAGLDATQVALVGAR
jgi:hypothetical protein